MTPEEWASVQPGDYLYTVGGISGLYRLLCTRRTEKTLFVQSQTRHLLKLRDRTDWFLTPRAAYEAKAAEYRRKVDVWQEQIEWATGQAATYEALAAAEAEAAQ